MVPLTMKQKIALCVHLGSPLSVVLHTVRIGHVLPMKHFRSLSTCTCKKIFARYSRLKFQHLSVQPTIEDYVDTLRWGSK